MKIVHITENYIEGWGYQENLLPLYQKRAGHDVVVISDNDHLKYAQNPTLAKKIISRGKEYEQEGIRIYKIKTYLATSTSSFFCKGVYEVLKKEKPDMIFHHNLNTSTLAVAVRYKHHHQEVRLYADNHADWINESKNRLWHLFYYDFLIPLRVKLNGDRVNFYIGVSPLRCKYLNKVFRVPIDKIRFLPIGCDTDQAAQVEDSRDVLKKRYGLEPQSYVIVSGGKIDRSKGTLTLIDACKKIRINGSDVKLVLFGKIDEEVQTYASQHNWVTLLGWCDRATTLTLLKMADVACWPWLHTTLIEDSVASGTPLVVKMSDNVSHFAKEKAGVFMKCGDCEELAKALLEAQKNNEEYRLNALMARDKYSYATLVERLNNESFFEL